MTRNLVVVNAGTSDPSSTRLLADRIAQRVAHLSEEPVDVRVLDLREIATEVTTALVAQHVGPTLRAAMDAIAGADGVIAATPVYAAGPSGLFSSFFQVLETDSLIGTPVVLAATAGTARSRCRRRSSRRPRTGATVRSPHGSIAPRSSWSPSWMPASRRRCAAATPPATRRSSGR